MYPFPLKEFMVTSAQNPWTYVVFLVIGFFFGYVLEIAGFGNSKKLAAQFYFTELTVLKVMFGAIVTAMVLLFVMIGVGLLDYNLVYVNTTYLWPMIVGGLIMGVGFIVGGFCPGTSLVSMATGKIDGFFFVGGVLGGIFLFGETEILFDQWWNTAGYLGRFTIMDWLNLPNGVVVTIIVAMALFMFWGAEQLERIFGKRDLSKEPKLRVAGAAALFTTALAVILIGTPSAESKYQRVTFTRTQEDGTALTYNADQMLANRLVQITPAEAFKAQYDQTLSVRFLDVRPEADYNLYHIRGAVNLPLNQLEAAIPALLAEAQPNAVIVLMSNGEESATEAWKMLVAQSVPNVYLLEGGINNWIALFGKEDPQIIPVTAATAPDSLAYKFSFALGDRYESCSPSPMKYETLEFTPKIKLQLKRDQSGGGCG